MRTLNNKTIFITGASRGIGRAIALRCAQDGANIVIAAKTVQPHPKLEGTIHSAAAEVEAAGGHALPLQVDIREDAAVEAAMRAAVDTFGAIDALINNASAISMTGTLATPIKRFDLMNGVNARGTYLCSQLALPHLLRSDNPHILTLSPPLNLDPKWFAPHLAYTMAKYGMSMCTLGPRARVRAARRGRQLAVAAHDHRHRGGQCFLSRLGAGKPATRNHGRRRVRHSDERQPQHDRQFFHRRGGFACGRRDRFRALCRERGCKAAS
jgi:NAD(P)-dependent dehydrogenase (short-subunit alcohol dehydrogenase family)